MSKNPHRIRLCEVEGENIDIFMFSFLLCFRIITNLFCVVSENLVCENRESKKKTK